MTAIHAGGFDYDDDALLDDRGDDDQYIDDNQLSILQEEEEESIDYLAQQANMTWGICHFEKRKQMDSPACQLSKSITHVESNKFKGEWWHTTRLQPGYNRIGINSPRILPFFAIHTIVSFPSIIANSLDFTRMSTLES